MAWEPALFPGFTSGDRPRVRSSRPLAGGRSCTLGSHVGCCHRTHDRGNDGRGNAFLRSGALSRRAVRLTREREFPKIVAIADIAVEERAFRKGRLKRCRYLDGNIDVFVDTASDECHG